MARYTYNAGLVTQTIDTLYTACDCLEQTNVDIKKGIDMIYNARGAENMNIDFSPITGYQSTVVEYIETMATEIQKKAQEIEEYQNTPWYKKVFATVVLGALKIIEGLATFVENIGDGIVSSAGFVVGIFSSDFKNSCAEFVRTDLVGDAFAKGYEGDGVLGWLNDNAYMSHESTAANVLKGIGTATGYVLTTVATAGLGGSIAASSTAISAGTAALGGIGSGTQNALKQAQLANPEMSAGDAFNSAFGQGLKQGAIAAGTTLLTAGIAKGLQGAKMTGNGLQFFDDVVTNADDIAKLSRGARFLNSSKQAITKVGNTLLNNGVGRAAIEGVQTIGGTAIGGALINASAPVVGATASGQFKKNAESDQIDMIIEEVNNPSVATQLYTETQEVLQSAEAKTSIATEEESAQNLEKLKEQGYNPGSAENISQENTTSGTDTQTTTPGTNTSTAPTATRTPVPTSATKVTVSQVEITTPQSTTQPTASPSGTTSPSTTTPPPTTIQEIISTIRPTDIVQPTTNQSEITTLTDSDIVSEATKEIANSEALNTFGEVSGSLSGLSNTKTSIPTSSSPLISSSDGSSNGSKFVPLGAGLGAASIAGIGAKAYLDKREKSKEEESDDIETEEWASQDDVEIDYGLENDSADSDYLSPADELAFTE